MNNAQASAASEWKRFGFVPIAAALGYSTSVIHIYGLGPYIEPIQETFNWSRAQATSGLTIATVINAVFCIAIGMVVDRVGPRMVGLIGVLLTTGAFALIGTATGGQANWIMLWVLMAFATLPVQATIWTSAVASRFELSRGMALAVTLSGASVAAAVFPVLATWLIGEYGWRTAIKMESAIWAAITFPMLFFFFRGARDTRADGEDVAVEDAPVLQGVSAREGFSSSVFLRLLIASFCFSFILLGFVVHFVPMLSSGGTDRLAAAGIAGLVGVFSIIGRLGTGFLLDRFDAARVGALIFLLPILAAALLLYGGGSTWSQSIAAAVLGLTLGSEIDVIVYLTTRHFGLKNFGAIYGGLLTALSLGTATGPLVAAAIYDQYQSYDPFFIATAVFMVISSSVLLSLPKPKFAQHE